MNLRDDVNQPRIGDLVQFNAGFFSIKSGIIEKINKKDNTVTIITTDKHSVIIQLSKIKVIRKLKK